MNAKKPEDWESPGTKEIELVLEKVKIPKEYPGKMGRFKYIAESLGISTQTIYDWLHGRTHMKWVYWYTLKRLKSCK